MYLLQGFQQGGVVVVGGVLLASAQQDLALFLAQPAHLDQDVQHRNAVAAATRFSVCIQEAFLEVDLFNHAYCA